MSKNTAEEQKAEKKGRGKKPLVALLLAALLGLGAYGGATLYNNESNKNTENEATKTPEVVKDKITISVSGADVLVNDQKQALAEGQNWKQWLEEYFSKKDMAKTEVTVDYSYGDKDVSDAIKAALNELKISVTEK